MNNIEYKIHVALVEFVTLKFPHVEIRSDLAGIKMPMGLAVKVQKLNGYRRAWPDIFIAEPMGRYCGLFIEIKKDCSELYCKNGDMRKAAHIVEQSEKLESLRKKGYCAEFCCGLDECICMVGSYLDG